MSVRKIVVTVTVVRYVITLQDLMNVLLALLDTPLTQIFLLVKVQIIIQW